VPTHALSELTRDHVKVALSGDGGDEVFGGYPKYLLGASQTPALPLSSLLDRCLRATAWRPRGVAGIYGRLLSSQDRIRFAWARHGDFPVFRKDIRQLLSAAYQDAAEVTSFFEPWERRAQRHGPRFDTDVLMRADLETYLSENCLVKTDRASMLASLEVRVPYLDETVLDRILPLPGQAKISGGELKALLMPIARRLLPKEVWDRPKQGFGSPLDEWLAGAWRPAVETALDWGESNLPLFDYGYLRRLHAINMTEGGCGRELWNPFVFLAWTRVHSITL
jgi:asparagine synthase (glutamine-hydrolysing)